MTSAGADGPLAGPGPLIDVHAHFYHVGCGRANWERHNAARFRAGERIGISVHVGSILGSWGANSPTYFQSREDTVAGNDAMLALQRRHPERVRSYCAVNPNDGDVALSELDRCRAGGAIGIKLAAARRAHDPLLDPIAQFAAAHRMPVLHHMWQHRRGDVATQDCSDAVDLARLAERHPAATFILAHIAGGGDYMHTFPAVRDVPNILLDLSGSGVDRGMVDDALEAVGARRLLWGADLTLETALARLWALEAIGLDDESMADIRWRNAARIFPAGAFPALEPAAEKTRRSDPPAVWA
jgi:predicted TIM-barrel fold metal-dependent hydrolase